MTQPTTEARIVPNGADDSVWLQVGRLVDGSGDAPIADGHLVYDANSILYAGAAPPPDAMRPPGQSRPHATLPDHTVLPGLIESHAHLFLDGAPIDFERRKDYLTRDADWLLNRGRARWPKILSCGITAVRDAGDKDGVGLALTGEYRRSAERCDGKSETPYIDSPGAAIHHEGRYGKFMGTPIEDHQSPDACVASRVADGAHRIKLLVTGIINFKKGAVTTPPQMPVEEVQTLVAAAEAHDRQTFAHASGADGVGAAIEGGVTTVEHGYFVSDDQLSMMCDRRTGWVPTIAPVQIQVDRAGELGWDDEVVGHLERILDGHRRALRRAHESGVRVIAGSDAGSCGVAHGIGFLWELELMEAAGLPAASVIRSATGAPGDTLGFAERLGRLKTGYRTRFILTRHDPTETVTNLRKPKRIVHDGRLVTSDGLPEPDGL
ncbi:MAG: hypothetical protein CMJ18_11325 [Phycisphaeraceae bacterium]|nr:hypothetical protein [Phycisphaeraceae bacterium]